MNRLTKEFNGEYYHKNAKTIMFNNKTEYNAIQKLGKLEDVMEHFMINSIEQLIDILKAWETSKNKSVDLYDIKTSKNVEEFNCDLYEEYQLTEDEFKLLRKILKQK